MTDDLGELTTLRLRIEGFVQAVGYRNFAIAEANRLKLNGWVRNRSDGTVEALISGPQKIVEEFVGLAMRGPTGSQVKNIEIHNVEEHPQEQGFKRRPSI